VQNSADYIFGGETFEGQKRSMFGTLH